MKDRTFILAVIASLAAGLVTGVFLLPDVVFWKIVSPVAAAFLVFFFVKKAGVRTAASSGGDRLETLSHLLKNIENADWGADNREFSAIKEMHPGLANQLLKVQHLYHSNKQFTQNAAHELQTPLAIIKGHAELLLQAPSLNEKEATAIGAILHNINRLSRINATLILLSKIEHGRFADEQPVRLNEIIDATLDHFSDTLDLKEIKVEKEYRSDFVVHMSATLAEILIANLLQNAIRHNLPSGFIRIETDRKGLKISNPGKPLATAPENLFKRFYRESKKEESLGLGLSIVKRIVEQSGLEVSYVFADGVHSVGIISKK